MEVILYHMPRACSRVTMTAIEQIGLEYQENVIDIFRKQQKSPEYLNIHPGGKVPALSVDGRVLTENVAILHYLHKSFPDAGLLPAGGDLFEDSKALADLVWCGGTLHPLIRQIRMPIRYTDGDPSGVYEMGIVGLSAVLEGINERLAVQPWWYGEQWSIVDVYFAWCCATAESGGFPLANYEAVKAHAERLLSVESYVRALEKEKQAEERAGVVFPPPPK